MEIYIVVNSIIGGDQFDEYIGTDSEKAKKVAYASWNRMSAHDQKRSIVEARVYEVPDETNFDDEYEITDAICEYPNYDLLVEYSQETNDFVEKLNEELELSWLEEEEFAKRLGFSFETLNDWLNGIGVPEFSEEREKIIKKAVSISEEEQNKD